MVRREELQRLLSTSGSSIDCKVNAEEGGDQAMVKVHQQELQPSSSLRQRAQTVIGEMRFKHSADTVLIHLQPLPQFSLYLLPRVVIEGLISVCLQMCILFAPFQFIVQFNQIINLFALSYSSFYKIILLNIFSSIFGLQKHFFTFSHLEPDNSQWQTKPFLISTTK